MDKQWKELINKEISDLKHKINQAERYEDLSSLDKSLRSLDKSLSEIHMKIWRLHRLLALRF